MALRFLLCVAAALCAVSCASMPNDCTIVAVEKQRAVAATARLQKVHVWSRVLSVYFEGRDLGHSLCVYQPARDIVVYDANGSRELALESHDPLVIARARYSGDPQNRVASARFLE